MSMISDDPKSALPKRKVSVVVPSYNHEKFLPAALESVVQQTYQDYEVVINDDASADNSVACIQEFIQQHPEIPVKFMRHQRNMGGVITLNELVEKSEGEYIALINSDDIWLPQKLEQQVKYLDAHPEIGAVFTQAICIDSQGERFKETVGFPDDIFIQKNRSRGKWLRRLFLELNCFCHPSILIRRSVYDAVGLYDPRLRQLPDFQMWVRVLKHTGIYVIEQPLVQLRIHTSNTSKVSKETITRNLNEIGMILSSFFDGMPDDVFVDGFGDLFKKTNASTREELACEKAFIYFKPEFVFKSLYMYVGVMKLHDLFGKPETNAVLQNTYTFGYEEFFSVTGTAFLDNELLSPTFLFAQPPQAQPQAQAVQSEETVITWRYWFTVTRFLVAARLQKYPLLFQIASKSWRLFRRMRRKLV